MKPENDKTYYIKKKGSDEFIEAIYKQKDNRAIWQTNSGYLYNFDVEEFHEVKQQRHLSNILNPNLDKAKTYFTYSYNAFNDQRAQDTEWQNHLEWVRKNIILAPKATESLTTKELESMGMAGVYSVLPHPMYSEKCLIKDDNGNIITAYWNGEYFYSESIRHQNYLCFSHREWASLNQE